MERPLHVDCLTNSFHAAAALDRRAGRQTGPRRAKHSCFQNNSRYQKNHVSVLLRPRWAASDRGALGGRRAPGGQNALLKQPI